MTYTFLQSMSGDLRIVLQTKHAKIKMPIKSLSFYKKSLQIHLRNVILTSKLV